jgi:hypothetical protein
VSKGLIKTDYQKNRDYLVEQMKKYYYGPSDKVYNTWSDSEIKSWLVNHNVIKPEAQVKREKLIKLISCVPLRSTHPQTLSHTSLVTISLMLKILSGVPGPTPKSVPG